ncbi:MAG: TPM domain-containing protein [Prolixibacteraceae bacterium]|nr:TPM domain-containing protein [Prolixibacteraceae bacterium]
MKLFLSDADKTLLDKRIQEAEKITKTQIVLATVRRSDSYAEIPWLAFALGSSIAGLMVFLSAIISPVWISGMTILIPVMVIMGTGGFFALLTIMSEKFAKLFLSESRAETEIRQFGTSLFLNRELFSTSARTGILLLISQFERKVFILPDKGLTDKLSPEKLSSIISEMKDPLDKRQLRTALETGLDKLVKALMPPESDWPDKNELPDKIIEEEGE